MYVVEIKAYSIHRIKQFLKVLVHFSIENLCLKACLTNLLVKCQHCKNVCCKTCNSHVYIYIRCLSVRFNAINVKTAELTDPAKNFCGTSRDPREGL